MSTLRALVSADSDITGGEAGTTFDVTGAGGGDTGDATGTGGLGEVRVGIVVTGGAVLALFLTFWMIRARESLSTNNIEPKFDNS